MPSFSDKPHEIDDLAIPQAALVQALGQIIYDWRPQADVLLWRGDVQRLLGYTPAEMGNNTASWTDRVHPDDLAMVLDEVEQARAQRRSCDLEYRFRHRDGHYLWMQDRGVLFLDPAGELERMVGVFRDVTERKHTEAHLARLNRTRALMSDVNALIVRTRSRVELLEGACRIAVEVGGFGLAWIGVVGDSGELVAIARHGDDGGYLQDMRLSLQRTEPDACLMTLRAAREGRPQVSNNIPADATFGVWRERLQALGYGSAVSLPLTGERMLGTLNLYARETGSFDDEEMTLLTALGADVAYAMEFILRDETLGFLTVYDPLTRLPNRALFIKRLRGFLDDARESGHGLAVLMLDIERFKAINDAIGHAGGDELLKQVAEGLKGKAGGPGFVARLGGDRFAAVVPHFEPGPDPKAAILAGWHRPMPAFRHGDRDFSITFKIGAVVVPQNAGDAEVLLRDAELALKQGRAAGNAVTLFTAPMGQRAARKTMLEVDLRRALQRGEFRVHYQPKIDLRSGALCGAEGLLRWNGPDGTPVRPDEMIPVLEETGFIVDVGRWVVEQALRDRESWLAQGLPAPRIAVNVSAVQIRQPDFVRSIGDALAATPRAANALELEVTESMMLGDADVNVEKLRVVRELGVTIALDDFGTGYSSLAYLGKLPLDSVKIDGSFVSKIERDRNSMTLVGAIISLAHAMNLKAVAEAVESENQLQFLDALRCDAIQGFLFSKALPADDFAALLRSGRRLR